VDTFLEGIEVTRQPCTLALLIPSLALTLAARPRAFGALIGFGAGASILAWAQAARHWEVRDIPPATVIGGLLAVVAVIAVANPSWLRDDVVVGGAVVTGAIAGWLWRPCVGPQLADILNNADTDGVRTLSLMTIYLAGVLLPAMLLTLAPIAAPRLVAWRDAKWTRAIGLSIALLWAGAITIGVYDDVVSELLKRSTA
jgi:hypothetical protein